MKRINFVSPAPLGPLLTLVCLAGAASAQETGYINGSGGLFSFNPSNGAIVGPFSGVGTAEPFAVSGSGAAFYLLSDGTLTAVSGVTGQIIGSVTLPRLELNSVALTKDGATAYVASGPGVSVIDTATLSITGSVMHNGPASDLALSPDDSTLYMSVDCHGGCSQPGVCPINIGLCAFDASKLAFDWQVKDVSGLLSVSNDGSYLYAAGFVELGKPAYPLNAINSATQALANLGVYWKKDMSPSRVITDPASHYAVVLEQSDFTGIPTPTSAYILDTSTNTFVKVLFAAAPGGMEVMNTAGGAAFAPDGKSVWMLLSCGIGVVPNCSDESGQIYLAGFSLPSGTMISDQPIPGEFPFSGYHQSIAFPR